jgi:anti-sigma regulatory factor (Ser/Thr protein kinase)
MDSASSTLSVPAVDAAPGLARAFTREFARRLRIHPCDVAELCVSELVTNAVNAAGRDGGRHLVELTLAVRPELGGTLFVGVRDRLGGRPVVGEPDDADEGGRGLLLVQALSRAWGVDEEDGGKVVWCALAAWPTTGAGLPVRTPVPRQRPPGRRPETDPAVLARVVEKLRAL